ALFGTDITTDPTAKGGDWQSGGTPIAPSVIFGSWKYFAEAITNTNVALVAGQDPAKNNWSLGTGSDTPSVGFAALKNEGYGAELRWNLSDLIANGTVVAGHRYRFYFIDHDGDQNKTGGDSAQAGFFLPLPALTTPPTHAA